MTGLDAKADLRSYLQDARDALLWKLEGLSEYDVRRPMTPTGTNLLGLVKHLTGAEAMYFGATFGRPFDTPTPLWIAGEAEPNADLWATAEESREQIVGLYRRVWAHSDATIEALPLDAVGRVAWGRQVELTLHRALVHMIAETDRHAGHADVVRELVDGTVGLREGSDSVATGDAAWWEEHRGRVERAAREAGGRPALRVQRLHADHADALLAFERANRSYFARSVSDRGDAYFAEFDSRHRALLAEQDAGGCHFHVVLDDRGELIGRVNLVDVEDGSAELGYRIGEHASGRGTATAAVREVCRLAGTAYGLSALTAITTRDNLASMAVLRRTGFAEVADIDIAGRPGARFRRAL